MSIPDQPEFTPPDASFTAPPERPGPGAIAGAPDGDGTLPPPSPPPRLLATVGVWVAWILIMLVVAVALIGTTVQSRTPVANPGQDNAIESVMIGMQGRVMVGANQLSSTAASAGSGQTPAATPAQTRAEIDALAESLRQGAIGQRLRFVILATELGGAEIGREELDRLNQTIADRISQETAAGAPNVYAIESDLERVRSILDATLPPANGDPSTFAPSTMSDADRTHLIDTVGWFGGLYATIDDPESDFGARVRGRAAYTLLYMILVLCGIGGLALIGCAMWLVALYLAVMGRLPLKYRVGPRRDHGVFAETFAVWLVGFTLIQIGLGVAIAALRVPDTLHLPLTLGAFVLSLGALVWPSLRGIAWRRTREEIGWTTGSGVIFEAACGILGYAMGLPLLAVGVLLATLLMFITGGLGGPGSVPELDPLTGPAHPIIGELEAGSMLSFLVVIAIGSLAAPLIEETFFRGVLYRHLRDGTHRGLGLGLSIAGSAVLSSFVFAAIHPQGVVGIPPLMALALMFSLVREWRGSLIAPMVMHGVSNGIVLGSLGILVWLGRV